jgi:hypothetical protein
MAVANIHRGFSYAREKLSNILPIGGIKTASVVIISGIVGQIFAKWFTQSGPSSETIQHSIENNITTDESLREFETASGRVAAVAAFAILTGLKLSKEASYVRSLGFTTIWMVTSSIISNTQIVGKALSYLSGETIDPTDTLGRNLPSVMGIALDPLICKIALSTAVASAALSNHIFEKICSFVSDNYLNRGV